MTEFEESAGALSALRNEERMRALEACARVALADVVASDNPVSLIFKHRGAYRLRPLTPGMTVRVWANQGRMKTVLNRLQGRTWHDQTYTQHLLVQILPDASSGKTSPSYTIGFVYDGSNLRKPDTSIAHILSKEPSEIITPDINFQVKLDAQRARPDQQFISLAAIGILTEKHISALTRLVSSAIEVGRVRRYANSVYAFSPPEVGVYRLVAWGCPSDATHNCTSFVERIFPDIVFCQNMFGLSNPSICKALHVKEESFGGCDEKGRLWRDDDAHMAHVMDVVHRQHPKPRPSRDEKGTGHKVIKRSLKGRPQPAAVSARGRK